MSDVDCPSCKGGCRLCGGSGRVREIVASVYMREEARATMKLDRKKPFPDELPTKPDLIKALDRRRRIVRYVAIILFGTALGILVGVAVAQLVG